MYCLSGLIHATRPLDNFFPRQTLLGPGVSHRVVDGAASADQVQHVAALVQIASDDLRGTPPHDGPIRPSEDPHL